MKDLWTYLKEEHAKGRPIVLYGTGDGADKIIARLSEDGISVSGVFASEGFVRDRYYRDMKVESFDGIKTRLEDPIVLVSFGSSRPDVIEAIDKVAYCSECYAPDVPVCGGEVFDAKFYNEHQEQIDGVISQLADDFSRDCMRDLIRARLTGRIEYLHKAECGKEDIYSLIDLPEDAIFYDLGAYNGDTVKEYLSLFPSISRIVAVEPEPHNYRKLESLKDQIGAKLDPIRAIISDSCYGSSITASARGRGTRGNPASSKTIATPAISVDSIAKDFDPPHLIKFDIEGYELAGIRGAHDTILNCRPVMRIACYHRSEDIFKIPLEVLKIRPDYKVYLRHLPSIPGWDTDFIFV